MQVCSRFGATSGKQRSFAARQDFLSFMIRTTCPTPSTMRITCPCLQRKSRLTYTIVSLPLLDCMRDCPDELVAEQHKFMKSQTWYRPHGTQTHRAFPVKYATSISRSALQMLIRAIVAMPFGLPSAMTSILSSRYVRHPCTTFRSFDNACFSVFSAVVCGASIDLSAQRGQPQRRFRSLSYVRFSLSTPFAS